MLLQISENPTLQEIYNNHTIFDDSDYGTYFEKACYKKAAVHYWNNEIYDFKLPCNVLKIQKPLARFRTTLLFKNNSPFIRIYRKK